MTPIRPIAASAGTSRRISPRRRDSPAGTIHRVLERSFAEHVAHAAHGADLHACCRELLPQAVNVDFDQVVAGGGLRMAESASELHLADDPPGHVEKAFEDRGLVLGEEEARATDFPLTTLQAPFE